MGEFVYIDNVSAEDKHSWGPTQKKSDKLFLQFIPATVIDVVTNSNIISSPAYDGPSTINCITAKLHYGPQSEKQITQNLYYPLLRGIVDTPCKGDSVLVLTNTAGENYYLGPLNSLNNPNFNIDPLNTGNQIKNGKKSQNERDRYNISPNFTYANVARLQKPFKVSLDNRRGKRKGEELSTAYQETFGDMLLEGRYGNSIRIGSRDNTPNLFISNGRNGVNPIESLYDGSIFTMTSYGSLKKHFHNFNLASDVVEGNNRLIGGGNADETQQKFNYDFGDDDNGTPILRNQIFMASDKITFNSRIDNITLSSYLNLDIGAGNNLTINTKNYTSIESSNIYLGKQAQEQKEPIVLGSQLKEFLNKFLEIVGQSTALVHGAPVPVTDEKSQPIKVKIQDLINELESPTFLSEYHFIEDNGQKAD
jgi:hypothetical protein